MDDGASRGGDAETAAATPIDGGVGGGLVSHTNPHPSPLFPLFPVSSNPSSSSSPPPPPLLNSSSSAAAPQWLCNPSFTLDASAISGGARGPECLSPEPPSPGSDGELPAPAPPAYDLLRSSEDEEEDGEERRSRREERRRNKKKKRKRERSQDDDGLSKKVVLKPAKEYRFDLRGDPDNLAYGSLYRMDISRYKLHNRTELSGLNFQLYYWRRASALYMDLDGDMDVLDSKLKSGSRYCSVKYSTLERHKGFKHVKIMDKKVPSITPGEFIPLMELHSYPENGSNGSVAKEEFEESWEDELLRKTREFNRMSRDFPHDEKVWLAFADFQDKIASKQPQKAARLQTLEKKISILEKAVDLNPENEELLLCLLKSYQGRDSTDVLIEIWEKILMQHSDSSKLWKEFLLLRQGEFSRFKVSDMRNTYGHAIQALSSACIKLCRQGCQSAWSLSSDPALVQLELGLVDIFISLCRFEWQTGHQELATGLFQAEIEYSLFSPSLFLSSQSKERLFEHFWNSGGARVGEDGALGWSTWLEREEHNRQNLLIEENSHEAEEGGWTGWRDLSSMKGGTTEKPEKSMGEDVGDENTEESVGAEDIPQEDDIEVLMKRLGINIDSEPHSEVKDTTTWNRWSEVELSRDSEQWMPVHRQSGGSAKLRSDADSNPAMEGGEQLSRIILFEDVCDYLFSLFSEEARISLMSQFIDFYGGKVSQWICTNNPTWIEKILSLETVPDSILEDLRVVFDLVNGSHCSTHDNLEFLLGSTNDLSRKTNMMKFLRNTILLCLDVFPRNYKLEEALLVAEECCMSQMNASACSVNPSRVLAKGLLKNDRQDLLLCGVYAQSEAAYGNIDLARKIFDMALSSTDGLPLNIQQNVPLLYLWYAEMEMARSTSGCSSDPSSLRAVHILSCLGGNVKYTPYTCQPSGLTILRARQGYKEQIKSLRSTWARGEIREYSIALICSASLFEILTTSWSAGVEVIEEAFSMVLPERRSRSLQLELLWFYYIRLLLKHIKQLKFSRVWETISNGLQVYPYSPKTFSAMVKVGYHFTVPNKVRRIFDECSQRKPSVIVWLFALSYELCKAGSQHRIHGLFERALADDKMQKSVLLWRCYLAYEADIAHNPSAARRVFFRAIHACPWSKRLWLDGFQKLSLILSTKELSDLQEVMRDKELNLRTDIYEILLQDDIET